MSDSFLDMSFNTEIPDEPARVIPKMKQEATLIAVEDSGRYPVKKEMADVVEWAIVKAKWEFTFGVVTDFFKKDVMTLSQDVFIGLTKDGVPSSALKESGSPVNASLRNFYKAFGEKVASGGLNSLVGKSAMATVGPEERDGQPTGYARVFAVYPVKA